MLQNILEFKFWLDRVRKLDVATNFNGIRYNESVNSKMSHLHVSKISTNKPLNILLEKCKKFQEKSDLICYVFASHLIIS